MTTHQIELPDTSRPTAGLSDTSPPTTGWTVTQWQRAYRDDAQRPEDLLAHFSIASDTQDNAWIVRASAAQMQAQLDALEQRRVAVDGDLRALPLYGVPFAIKDNIDAQGWPTTAACPAFRYMPHADATVVAKLRAAGAILVGKTNLDQFATGLVGTRSPYGEVVNTFDARYVSGGSSSGSASTLARGLVAFSLGTDTAGSGRVPAGFNNVVGLKPTRGWLSTSGVVPACRTLDCVSIFALTVEDARIVADAAGGYDATDPYSRLPALTAAAPTGPGLRLAIPATLTFCDDTQAKQSFEAAVQHWRDLGATIVAIDYTPFAELAALLYSGPWVAERFAALEALWQTSPDEIHPVVRTIVEQASQYDATAAFKAEYKRAALSRAINDALAGFDALLVPTSPTLYTREAMRADPIRLNSHFGTYTNFTNLADLSALAVPAGLREDGLPAGITLISLAWRDHALAALGEMWQRSRIDTLGATGKPRPSAVGTSASPTHPSVPVAQGYIRVAVVGAHLTGMPLNHQLTSREATLVEATHTASTYRLYALANTAPPKPGLVHTDTGQAIEVELWDVPAAAFGTFVAEIPAPLGIGTLTLADGRDVKGFICEPRGLIGARDITAFGGWRAYIASLKTPSI